MKCNCNLYLIKYFLDRSGTWAMTGEDVIQNGTIIIPQYVRNLNRLVVRIHSWFICLCLLHKSVLIGLASVHRKGIAWE